MNVDPFEVKATLESLHVAVEPETPWMARAIKCRARREYRRFLKRTVVAERGVNVKVLCLPSYEAAEVWEVYDRLGISRKNIHAAEIREDWAKILQEKNLGIHVHHSDVFDLIAKWDGPPFDVVNLDFTGHFSLEMSEGVAILFDRQLLSDRGVFALTFSASREQLETQRLQTFPLVAQTMRIFALKGSIHDPTEDLRKLLTSKAVVERAAADLIVLSEAWGIYDAEHKAVSQVMYGLETHQEASGHIYDAMLKAYEVGRTYHPIRVVRFRYVSGHTPMRMFIAQFRNLKGWKPSLYERELEDHLAKIGYSHLPPTVPIASPDIPEVQNMDDDRAFIMEAIAKGNIIEERRRSKKE
jgi:hypothetical protein